MNLRFAYVRRAKKSKSASAAGMVLCFIHPAFAFSTLFLLHQLQMRLRDFDQQLARK